MKIRVTQLLMVVALVSAIVLAFSSIAMTKEKAIELSYSSFFPAQYGAGQVVQAWADEVGKRTNGRVKVTVFASGTLTSAVDAYEGTVMGTSDIGHSCFAYTRGRFPLIEVLDLPGYPYNGIVTSKVADEFAKKFQPKELSDTHILYVMAHPPGSIITAKKSVRTLEDLKGLRVRCTGLSAKIVESLGAVPVAMPKGDQYDALLKGVVDGTTASVNELKGWRLAEVADYTAFCPRVGYVTAMFVAMNKKKWGSLPSDIQKIITEINEEWVLRTGEMWNRIELEGYKVGKEKGHTVIALSPEECGRWEKAMQPLYEAYVKEKSAMGLPAKEALEYRDRLIEKFEKQYPSIELN